MPEYVLEQYAVAVTGLFAVLAYAFYQLGAAALVYRWVLRAPTTLTFERIAAGQHVAHFSVACPAGFAPGRVELFVEAYTALRVQVAPGTPRNAAHTLDQDVARTQFRLSLPGGTCRGTARLPPGFGAAAHGSGHRVSLLGLRVRSAWLPEVRSFLADADATSEDAGGAALVAGLEPVEDLPPAPRGSVVGAVALLVASAALLAPYLAWHARGLRALEDVRTHLAGAERALALGELDAVGQTLGPGWDRATAAAYDDIQIIGLEQERAALLALADLRRGRPAPDFADRVKFAGHGLDERAMAEYRARIGDAAGAAELYRKLLWYEGLLETAVPSLMTTLAWLEGQGRADQARAVATPPLRMLEQYDFHRAAGPAAATALAPFVAWCRDRGLSAPAKPADVEEAPSPAVELPRGAR